MVGEVHSKVVTVLGCWVIETCTGNQSAVLESVRGSPVYTVNIVGREKNS